MHGKNTKMSARALIYNPSKPTAFSTLYKLLQDMLLEEVIQFQVCRNPDVKCAVVELAHRKIRDKIFRYFTFSNSYHYIDVLLKFIKAYNDTVLTTNSMAPDGIQETGGFVSRQPRFVSGSTSVSAKRK